MKYLLILAALVAGCTATEDRKPVYNEAGVVIVPGDSTIYGAVLRKVEVDGTACVVLQSGKGQALSCDWSKP